ncbi:MAG: GNAT family N-acetyltransferase [Pseudomonadota bacterium]
MLAGFCQTIHFGPGDILRVKGHHYRDVYLITEGYVTVRLDTENERAQPIEQGPGALIGEFSFLKGCPATATVKAKTAGRALVVNDRILRRIEGEQPKLAVRFSKYLASILEQRQNDGAAFLDGVQGADSETNVEVYLCRNDAMLAEAFRVRYQVYCEELDRESPNADHENKIIRDPLDDCGLTFIAVKDDETVGTIRGNLSAEGPLGILEDFYNMDASIHHPQKTGVITKFAVKNSSRGGVIAMKLIAAIRQYGGRHNIRECYIDCIPRLLPLFKFFGFKVVGDKFIHYENGASYPMMIDLAHQEEG